MTTNLPGELIDCLHCSATIAFCPKGSAVIAVLCVWACSFATYLVLAGDVSADEVAAGALCAVAAVFWWVGIRRASAHTFAFNIDALAAAGRGCRKLPGATLSVAGILLRTLVHREGGEIVHRFFAHGRRSDPDDCGRRAVGVIAASLAPDSFVLRASPVRDEIVVHGLPVGAAPKDPRWPI